MTGPDPTPPRTARRILVRVARRLEVPGLVDDADELFAEKVAAEGAGPARRWYRRQVRAAVARMLTEIVGLTPSGGARRDRTAGLWLDAKVGMRMLVRYPGLTVVGGLSLAFAIFVGAGLFGFVTQVLPSRSLPLPGGERVVGIRYWDAAEGRRVLPGPTDLAVWRAGLRDVRHLGGFRSVDRSLWVDGDGGEPVQTAAMSAAGFRLAATPPILGRTLVDADEVPGAQPVAVLGYGLWKSRFEGDPGVVGRTASLDGRRTTIVGVMPEGFRFPVSHELWTPLSSPGHGSPPGSGEGLHLFGRLVPGTSAAEVQAAAAVLAPRRDAGEELARLRVQVLPYREALFGGPVTLVMRVALLQINVFAALFLLLVAANVALLTYARAASRERELVVRGALGASRGRIVGQLFVEALLLAGIATAVGLGATGPGLSWLERRIGEMGGGTSPFWYDPGVSPGTALWAGLFALLAATVSGVLPGLKVTGRTLRSRLGATHPGAGGLRLGGVWTGIVVTQVAATMIFAAGTLLMVRQAVRSGATETTFPARQYIALRVESVAPDGVAIGELERRLLEDPAVRGVTAGDRLPLMGHPTRPVQLADEAAAYTAGGDVRRVGVVAVDTDFFEVFRTPVVAGRAFESGDGGEEGARPVIVDRFFVEQLLGGRSAVGLRLRFGEGTGGDAWGPWHEVVGVVRDLERRRPGALHLDRAPTPMVYRPLDPSRAAVGPVHLAVWAPDGAEDVAPRIHATVGAVSSSLRVEDVQRLDRVVRSDVAFWRLWADLVLGASAVVLLLALAGIYAVTSFTVSRRRREIGVRVALGARPARVVVEIFRRPILHVLSGITAGCAVTTLLLFAAGVGPVGLTGASALAGLAAGLVGLCAGACFVPTRRALAVEPAEALSAEG